MLMSMLDGGAELRAARCGLRRALDMDMDMAIATWLYVTDPRARSPLGRGPGLSKDEGPQGARSGKEPVGGCSHHVKKRGGVGNSYRPNRPCDGVAERLRSIFLNGRYSKDPQKD